MGSGEMKITEILEYSIKIEHESRLFYQKAAEKVTDESVRPLLKELEAEEIKHESRLAGILDAVPEGNAEGFSRENLDQLIQNRVIAQDATAQEVLESALEREKHTRDFYGRVATLTNLAADVVDLFDMLFEQETGHVTRISKKLERL